MYIPVSIFLLSKIVPVPSLGNYLLIYYAVYGLDVFML
jgi:hypothetical protein